MRDCAHVKIWEREPCCAVHRSLSDLDMRAVAHQIFAHIYLHIYVNKIIQFVVQQAKMETRSIKATFVTAIHIRCLINRQCIKIFKYTFQNFVVHSFTFYLFLSSQASTHSMPILIQTIISTMITLTSVIPVDAMCIISNQNSCLSVFQIKITYFLSSNN